LMRRPYPDLLPEKARFRPCQFVPRRAVTFPDLAGDAVREWGMTKKEDDAYSTFSRR
jgi:hypothetical protein